MSTQQSDAVVNVNNDSVGIVPNSLAFTEGLGDQKILPVSDGGGRVAQVFANDLETAFGMVKFSIRSTIENIELARSWKVAGNTNVIVISGDDDEGNDFIRTFTQASLASNYEVAIGTEGNIEIEFQSNSPT